MKNRSNVVQEYACHFLCFWSELAAHLMAAWDLFGVKSLLSALRQRTRTTGPGAADAAGRRGSQVLMCHPLMVKIIHNKFKMSPSKTQLGEQRKLGHNLSLKTCRSLHYLVLACETNGLWEGSPHWQSQQRAIFCRLMKDGECAW